MAHAMTTSVVRQLESLFDDGSVAGLSDRQLVERFVTARGSLAGEAAFAAPVARHGPMVLGIGRRLCADRHLAEDALQAAFLVPSRQARRSATRTCSAPGPTASPWRMARKARGRLYPARPRKKGSASPIGSPGAAAGWR
jgi:hypothetical protein